MQCDSARESSRVLYIGKHYSSQKPIGTIATLNGKNGCSILHQWCYSTPDKLYCIGDYVYKLLNLPPVMRAAKICNLHFLGFDPTLYTVSIDNFTLSLDDSALFLDDSSLSLNNSALSLSL